jgi:iron complex outermembrane receptor protein
VQVNYTDGLYDQRADNTASGVFGPMASLGGQRVTGGANIDSFTSADFTMQLKVTDMVSLTGSVLNIFDKAPPFAREDYSYEPFIGNPYGRQFKIGFTSKF